MADSPENVRQMAEYEKAISGKVVHWLPKSELPEAGLPWIMNGDIIAITTKMPGLDIAHVGIAEYKRKTAPAARFFYIGKSSCQR